MDADEPQANPRHEKYCRERVAGKTQRQAMLAAWPDLSRWKPEAVDNKAYKLEAKDEVKTRIARLKRIAAQGATTTRAEVLAGMSETFQAGIERVRGAEEGRPLDCIAVNAVTQLGKTLLDALSEEEPGEPRLFCCDYALLIGCDFFRLQMLMAESARREF